MKRSENRLERLTESDIPAAMALKNAYGWNQLPRDWRRFLRLGGEGCIKAGRDGALLGTAAVFVFRQARERLKPGGVMILHLGESRKCDMARALGAVARPWFEVYDVFSESVEHCESHGIRDKGTVTAHQYLILR